MSAKRIRRAIAVVGAAGVAMGLLTACGGGESGPPQLTWYINPDNGGQADLAKKCTAAANGKYAITTSILPNSASAQREQLIRRLAAKDSSIDLMSIDPPFLPEFAEAGFLLDLPQDREKEYTDGVVESAVKSATWRDELAGIPFWANTQLLWYRKSVAQKAGLDMTKPVTWEQITKAAEQTGTTVAAQGARYEGYTVWINAVTEGAGVSILQNPEAEPKNLKLGLDKPGAEQGAAVIRNLARSSAAGPALSTAMEEQARSLFQSDKGGFMVNWPYVWQAAVGEADAGTLDKSVVQDIGWTVYPRTVPDKEAAPPFGGIIMGIGAYTKHPDEALAAATCVTTREHMTDYMLFSGNPSAAQDSYSEAKVVEQFPMADTIRESLEMAVPRPQTPFYNEVSESLQRTYHPPESVDPKTTPEEAAELIKAVLNKEALL